MKKIALISAISLVSLTAVSGSNLKFDRTLSMSTERLSAVEFDVGAGSLEIVGTAGNEIKINASIESGKFNDINDLIKAFDSKMLFSIERQSEFAMINAKAKDGMGWGKSNNILINLKVELPQELDLVIDDGSGSITVENIKGTIKIDDGSGEIILRNIGNDVQIDDGSGSIQIAEVDGELSIEDESGAIELKNISGSIDIEDGSGEIIAKDIGGDFKVDDGSGSIEVKNLSGQFKLIDDGSGTVYVNGERWGK